MQSSGWTVNVKVVRGTLGIAAIAKLSPEAVAKEAGLDLALLDDPDARIPFEVWLDTWQVIERLSGDRLVALRSAQLLPKGHFDVIDYMIASSEDLGNALARFCRYFALISTAVEHRLEGTVLRRIPAPGAFTRLPHPAEFAFAALVWRTRNWTEQAWKPKRIEFAHAAPPDLEEPRRVFQCEVVFDAAESAIHFDPATLELRMRAAEPELCRILDGHGRAALDRLPRTNDFVETVRGVLAKELRGGNATLDQCARRLGLGGRSVHRRLAEAGTTHTKLLDEVRQSLALRYLDDRSIAIAEVGFLLGFGDASAFYRAFRRWTGSTPAQYRTTGSAAQ